MRYRVLITLLMAFWPLAPAAGAAESTAAPSAIQTEPFYSSAPVTIDGVTLFHVNGVTAFPADQRAKAIKGRIIDFARRQAVPVDQLRAVDAGDRTNILAAGRIIMTVVDIDAKLEGVDRSLLTDIYLSQITEAVRLYREDRSPHRLLVGTGYALGATALLVVTLIGMRWGFRRIVAAARRRYRAGIQDLQLHAFKIVRAEQLWSLVEVLLRTTRLLITLVLIYLYLDFSLDLYPWTRPLAHRLFNMVLEPLSVMALGFLEAVPDLVFLAVLIVLVRYLLRMIRLYFMRISRGVVTVENFEPEWALPTYKIVRIVVVAFALVIAYPYIPGSESAAFKGVTIFLGVIFSLGSSSVISNIIAGYTLIYRRLFKVGDRIRIGDHVGDVMEVRTQVTHLRSPKNEEVIIPNSQILNSEVVNYSALAGDHGLILHTTVGIGYETPWRQVEAMLLQAAGRTQGLFTEPPPFVLQTALGDFCVTYELNVYHDQPQNVQLSTALHRNILDVFNENGVQIMTPAYVGDPNRPKVVPKAQWYSPPAQSPT